MAKDCLRHLKTEIKEEPEDILPGSECLDVDNDSNEIHIKEEPTDNEEEIGYIPPTAVYVKTEMDREQFCDETPSTIQGYNLEKEDLKKEGSDEQCSVFEDNLLQKNLGGEAFQCDICGKIYTHRAGLLRHIQSHNPDKKTYRCDVCQKTFKQRELIKCHVKLHTGETPFQCEKKGSDENCSVVEDNPLQRNSGGDDTFECDVCTKIYTQRRSLLRHIQSHDPEKKTYQCDVCQKTFKQRELIKCHVKLHTGETPFRCDLCGKRYIQKTHLNRHMCWHSGEKPYSCTVCEKSFIDSSTLAHHIAVHRVDEIHRCGVCGKTFGEKGRLARHKRIHDDAKPFWCPICPKGFFMERRYLCHEKSHSFQKPVPKPFMCYVCPKSFSRISSLNLHHQVHVDDDLQ